MLLFTLPLFAVALIYGAAALLPAIYLMKYIYRKDTVEKEPSMLLMSLLTLPQMVAELFTIRLKTMMTISAIVSLACSTLGLFCSYWIAVPASATIVILLITAYAVARIAKPRKA